MRPTPVVVVDDPFMVDPLTRARNIPHRIWGMSETELYKDKHTTLIHQVWSPTDLLKPNVKINGILLDTPMRSEHQVSLLAGPLFSVTYEAAPVPDVALMSTAKIDSQIVTCIPPIADECCYTTFTGTSETKSPFTFTLPGRDGFPRFPLIESAIPHTRKITRSYVANNQRNILAVSSNYVPLIDITSGRDIVLI
eukprot:gnl/Chilomastix_caulleri/3068.p1 GENE.gnl/Chilomastix_caulleri/3068~~gnl/Chilomastix_caulleri/3068.p1  ORF type:complete len:195 (-),score=41.82 gnl/Chilomastix_caulleri/3068:66-650(-)